jgi:polyprenyl-phospho-N-acetylgalactosaminyl synthase
MPPSGTIWVVVAAYNEASAIADVVGDVTAAGYRAVVVDDGSHDRTAEVAESAGAALVRHPINLGQGAALQTGIEFALARGANTIVTFDADGQHRAADIPGLVEALARHDADFALGSRFLGTTVNMPGSRRWLLKAASLFTRATTGLSITDSHNGLRAMTRRGATHIQLRQNRMAHASEILHQIATSGLKYVETPVTIHYSAYSLAKGQTLFDAVLIVLDLFARRLHR